MSVAILEAINVEDNGSYTLTQSGLIVIVGNGSSVYLSRPILGVSFGGVAATEIVRENGIDPKGGIWYIEEASAPVGASVLVSDWNGQAHYGFAGTIYVLGGVDSQAPILDSVSGFNDNTGTLDVSINTVSDGLVLVSGGARNLNVTNDLTATNAASDLVLTRDQNTSTGAYARATTFHSEVVSGGVKNIGIRWSETHEIMTAAASFRPLPLVNIDTDNEIDQHQRDVALNHSLASPLTSVLINSVEHIDLIQNSDAELKYIKRCYDAIGSDVTSVILKNGVDTDVTITGVTVNTTHPYPVYRGLVDSKSFLKAVNEVSGDNAAFRITSQPTKGVLDLSDPAKFLHNIDASKGGIYTPNPGATGTDSFTFEVHDPDESVALNRTQSGTVTINIVEGEVVPEPIVELVATIIITGPSELIHKRGTTYTDQGATALDGEGADITSSIITTNNVNDSVVGDYYVYYTVSGVTVRRKVNVVEITENSLRLVNRNRVVGF